MKERKNRKGKEKQKKNILKERKTNNGRKKERMQGKSGRKGMKNKK